MLIEHKTDLQTTVVSSPTAVWRFLVIEKLTFTTLTGNCSFLYNNAVENISTHT